MTDEITPASASPVPGQPHEWDEAFEKAKQDFAALLHDVINKLSWFTQQDQEDAHAKIEAVFPPAPGQPSIANKVPDDAGVVPQAADYAPPAPVVPSQETGGVTQAPAASDTPAEPEPEEAPPTPAEEPPSAPISEPEPTPPTDDTGGVTQAPAASSEPVEVPAPAPVPQTVEELLAENARLRALAGIGEPASGTAAGVVDVPQ